MSTLIDQIQAIREERDRLALKCVDLDVYRRFVESEGVERLRVENADLRAELASLRARVTEYLAAIDGGGITDFCHTRECRYWRLGKSHGPCTCGAVAKRERTSCAEAALRAEVKRG